MHGILQEGSLDVRVAVIESLDTGIYDFACGVLNSFKLSPPDRFPVKLYNKVLWPSTTGDISMEELKKEDEKCD